MIRLVENYEDFRRLRDEWNQLLAQSHHPDNVFLRHEWFDIWWRAFGADKQLFILLFFSERQLAGAAPFMICWNRYKGLPYKCLGLIEDPNAPSADFIVAKGEEEAVVTRFLDFLLKKKQNLWSVADLNKIDNTSPTLAACIKLFEMEGSNYILRDSTSSPYIPVECDYSSFLKTVSSKFRKQLRNKFNKLKKAGKIGFVVYDHPKLNGEHLKEAMAVSAKSWKHKQGTSMVSTPERRKFFTNLSKVAAENGWLRIWLLYLDGSPIATEYHLAYMRRTHAMRGDFDEAFAYLSPGSVLEAHIIEDSFENKLLEYDFCGLPYGYKLRWTTRLHERKNLMFYNKRSYSNLLHAAQKYLPVVRRKFLALNSRVRP